MLGQDQGVVSMAQVMQGVTPGGLYPLVQPPSVQAPAVLRPLRNPLYDTETIPFSSTPNEIVFYQRALSNTMANAATIKRESETNLSQSGQLPNPNHFQLFGFLIEPQNNVLLANFQAIYATSVFEFTFTGTRIYLQIPLQQIPQGLGPTGFSALYGQTAPTERTIVTNGVPHVKNLYAFNIGRFALMIRPAETFGARIRWPNGAPTLVTADTRLRCYLVGIYYQSI
jgi:hypothetical protein